MQRGMKVRIAPPVGGVPAVRHSSGSPLSHAAFVLLLIMALFGNFLLSGGMAFAAGGGGNVINQIAYLGVLLLAVAGCKPWQNPAAMLVLPFSLLLALGWAWLSITWSLAPAISARRVALLTVVTLTAFLSVRGIGYDRTTGTIRVFLVIALVMSYLAALLFPTVGIQYMSVLTERNYGGTWRGVFIDKNACGQFCLITVLFFVFGRFPNRQYLLRAAVVLLAVFLLYKTQSKTSLGVLGVALAFGFVARYNRLFRIFLAPLAAYALVIVIFFQDAIGGPFINALHDPDAFTGRGAIWASLVRYLHDHWLLGTGYGAFWAVGDLSPIYQNAAYEWVKTILTGHNGYLDIWVTIGLPGLILVIVATFVAPLLRIFLANPEPGEAALLASMIVGVAGISVTESVLFNTDFTINIFLMITIALIAEKVRARRVSAAAGHPRQIP